MIGRISVALNLDVERLIFISAEGGNLVNAASSPRSPQQAVQGAMKLLYFVSRQKNFLAASILEFSTQHVTFRLLWALSHYKQVCDTPLTTLDSWCGVYFGLDHMS